MTTVKEKKTRAKETKDKVVASFEVDYWGAKVVYNVHQTLKGNVYYKADRSSEHYAATILANKAAEKFIMAQKNAGIDPVFRIKERTIEGFIPVSTEIH